MCIPFICRGVWILEGLPIVPSRVQTFTLRASKKETNWAVSCTSSPPIIVNALATDPLRTYIITHAKVHNVHATTNIILEQQYLSLWTRDNPGDALLARVPPLYKSTKCIQEMILPLYCMETVIKRCSKHLHTHKLLALIACPAILQS